MHNAHAFEWKHLIRNDVLAIFGIMRAVAGAFFNSVVLKLYLDVVVFGAGHDGVPFTGFPLFQFTNATVFEIVKTLS